jgi:hydrogenase-4 component F
MTATPLLVVLPLLSAGLLLVIPRGWLARADLASCAVLLAVALILIGFPAAAFGRFSADGLGVLAAVLLAADGLAIRWNDRRDSVERAARHIGLAGMLLSCLGTDPALAWCGIVIAAAAAVYPTIGMAWDHVPLAGAALFLALFGTVLAQSSLGLPVQDVATPDMAIPGIVTPGMVAPGIVVPGMLAVGCLLGGYGAVAVIAPELAVPMLVIMIRLTAGDTGPPQQALVAGFGLAAMAVCALLPYIRPGLRRRPAWLFLGHAALVLMLIGLGDADARFAAMVYLLLLVLTRAAVRLGRTGDTAGVASVLGLAAMQPVGVFPAVVLMLTAIAGAVPWLLIPVGVGLCAMGWAALAGMPGIRRQRLTLSPAWLALLVILFIGWFLPAEAADWLRTIAGGTR